MNFSNCKAILTSLLTTRSLETWQLLWQEVLGRISLTWKKSSWQLTRERDLHTCVANYSSRLSLSLSNLLPQCSLLRATPSKHRSADRTTEETWFQSRHGNVRTGPGVQPAPTALRADVKRPGLAARHSLKSLLSVQTNMLYVTLPE